MKRSARTRQPAPEGARQRSHQPAGGANTLIDRLNDNDLVLKCLTRAVSRAVQQHKRAGNPIAVWRDGRVVLLGPEEISDPAPHEL